MLPAHFDDVTNEISRWMKPNFVRNTTGAPTRNTISNYEKYQTLHENNTNLRSITRCDKSIATILDNPKISPLS